MQISELAFEKIKAFEGCRLTAYQDAAGVWTHQATRMGIHQIFLSMLI